MKNRGILVFKYLYCSICLFFLSTIRVNAYIDPSVMTYAIQAIAGTAIALGTFVSVYWRKIRKLFIKEFNGSSDRNNESDDLVFKEADGRIHYSLKQESDTQVPGKQTVTKKSFKDGIRALLPGFALSLTMSFMLEAYAPFQLYFNNKYEFWFDFKLMLVPHIAATVLLFFVLFAVFVVSYLLYDRFCDVLVFFAFFVLIGLYIQGNFMSGHLPPMDGTTIDWSLYQNDIRLSWIIWILLLVIVVLLIHFLTPRLMKKMIPAVCAVLALVMIVTCLTAGIANDGFKKKDHYVALTNGELELGEDTNFVILMMDALDSQAFRTLLNDHPEYNEIFRDFTYYPNTLGAYPYTEYAVPHILTGIWNENKEDFRTFETRAMDESPLFKKLEDQGYDMCLYEDDLVYDSEHRNRFSNVVDSGFNFYSRKKYLEQMNGVILFQYLPYFMKHMTKVNNDFNSTRPVQINGNQIVNFWRANLQFYGDLKEHGITRAANGKTFKFIHLDGAHVPFWYDKDVNIIDEETGTYSQMVECCVTIMNAYLESMKEAGLYDNTVVILMADHGYGYQEEETIPLLNRCNPFLMVKGIGETHEFRIDEAPISYEDLQEAYSRLLDGKQTDEIFDWKTGDKRTRRYLKYQYTKENHIEEYFTDGYASDVYAMIPSGKEFNLSGN